MFTFFCKVFVKTSIEGLVGPASIKRPFQEGTKRPSKGCPNPDNWSNHLSERMRDGGVAPTLSEGVLTSEVPFPSPIERGCES
ncbi:MAG: hypothetical protein QOH70_3837 [Blastocatellia bacterium]|jgi:hypothetical protein|nr:hypothetical protein [Blastocatellia bacterium]